MQQNCCRAKSHNVLAELFLTHFCHFGQNASMHPKAKLNSESLESLAFRINDAHYDTCLLVLVHMVGGHWPYFWICRPKKSTNFESPRHYIVSFFHELSHFLHLASSKLYRYVSWGTLNSIGLGAPEKSAKFLEVDSLQWGPFFDSFVWEMSS